jgi:hypothetical protein
LCALIAALWDGVWNAALAQQSPTTRITVAFVGNQAIRARAGTSAPTGTGNPNAVQDGGQLRAIVALPSGDDDGQRTAFAVTGQMKLGG